MSILIPGMKMPTSCEDCPMCHSNAEYDYAYCCVSSANTSGNNIPSDCPLVPVPEHGRLIDADALGNSLEKLAADKWNQKAAPVNWSYAFEECIEMVDNAPTIIEQDFIKAPTTPADKEGE